MDNKSWVDIVITLITMIPAAIAAASSLKNGRILKNGPPIVGAVVRKEIAKATKIKTPKGEDWYVPPDL